MLKPNNAVIPEPSFLNKEILEFCKLLMYCGIFLSLTNNFLIPKENIKKNPFNWLISDLSG